mmetsp:Transcript_10916/g.29059  ORF Transcript_10916/g.29059 Transcript_10916/m.29059 type:complete len:331 (+) Transcript_10916:112-1104(+)
MLHKTASAGAMRPLVALDLGAEERGVGCLGLRRRPSGLCLESRDSSSDPLTSSERSTVVPEEQTLAPEGPDGMSWGETPTASVGAAMLEQMMKYKAAAALQPPPQARPAEEPPPAPAEKTVMLQIPLQVAAAHPLAAGVVSGLEVSLLETRLEDGCMIINLRVDVGAGGAVAFEPSLAPVPVAPAPAPAPAPARTRAVLAKHQLGSGKAAPRAVERSAMVCCHWKNKGWCKFQDTCKFQHPDHKRGVGLAAAAGAAVLARQQRAAPSPAAQPVAGEAGRHCQPTAAGTAPAFLTPPPAVSPRLSAAPPMVRWVAAAGVAVPAQPCAAYFR